MTDASQSPDDTPNESRAPEPVLKRVALWPLRALKGLYHWTVGLAETKYAVPALAGLGFAEASFFPIPPDPLLLALCFGKRRKSLMYGVILTVASVLGGVAGWYIGQGLFDLVAGAVDALGIHASWFGTAASAKDLPASEVASLPRSGEVIFYPDGYFYAVKTRFDQNAFVAFFSAALSPIPYKVFTIAGGVFDVSLGMLIAGSVAGRGLRFMTISALAFTFGDRIKPFIEKYFEWLTVILAVLGVLGFLAIKWLI